MSPSFNRSNHFNPADRTWRRCLAVVLACCGIVSSVCLPPSAWAQDKPAGVQRIKHQITGLFCPEREQDLRELFERSLTKFKLVSIDYANAEATFDYDPVAAFPGAKPEQLVERFDNELRSASKSTFGAKPLRTIATDKLKRIEIPIVGLDCKACSLAAYEIVARLKGVEQAQASFKEGRVTVLVDAEKIDQAELESALKQRGVTIKPRE